MRRLKENENIFSKCKRGVSDFFYEASVDLHEMFHGKNNKIDTVKKTLNRNRSRRIELLWIWSFLIIPIVNFIVFGIICSISSWPIAFEHTTTSGTTYDFYNFIQVVKGIFDSSSLFLESLLNTLKYWSFGFFVIMPLGYLVGFFLYKKIVGYKIFRYIFFIPSIIASVVMASFFKYLVGPGGQVQWLIEKIFGIKNVLLLANSKYAFGTLLFYSFYLGLMGNLLMWLASFSRIPDEIVEAGKLDGLTTLKEFRYLTFPITWPFVATMFMLAITGILGAGGAALLLTGGEYGTYDLGYYEYVLTTSGSSANQSLAGALGLMKSLIMLPVTLFINYKVKKIEPVEF